MFHWPLNYGFFLLCEIAAVGGGAIVLTAVDYWMRKDKQDDHL